MDNTIIVAIVAGATSLIGSSLGHIVPLVIEKLKSKQERRLKLLETYTNEHLIAHRNLIEKCSRFLAFDRKLASDMSSGKTARITNGVLYDSYEQLLSAAHSAVLVSSKRIGELILKMVSYIQLEEQYFYFSNYAEFQNSYYEYLSAFSEEYGNVLQNLQKTIE